jgi:hypothetical protein
LSSDEFRIMHEPPGRGGAYRLGQRRRGGLDDEPSGRGEDDITLSLGQLGQPLAKGREPLDRLAGVDPNDDRFDPSLVLPDVDPVALVRAPDAQLAAPGGGPRQERVQRAAPASGRLPRPPGIPVARVGGSGHQMQIELPASHVKTLSRDSVHYTS